MKKSKLIELLNKIDGNPEIKLWNGFVSDWVDINPTLSEQDLVKQTLAHYLETCRLEYCRDRNDWDYQMPAEEVARLEKMYTKVCKWEMNPYVTQEDIDTKRYSVKIVQIMQAKIKGENAWDRIGDMKY